MTALRSLILVLCLFASGARADQFRFVSQPRHVVDVGTSYQYTFEASDSAKRTIIYSVYDLPSWLRYDPAHQSLAGIATVAGQYLVRIHASAGDQVISQSFMLTVRDHSTVNILCLGNSITNGTAAFNSYRRSLWKKLHSNNYNFDLIGSWGNHHMGGAVPDPDFDMDHDGHSGWTASDMFSPPAWDSARGNITRWLDVYQPDIVLIELGTNDVFQCRASLDVRNDFAQLLNVLRRRNPEVKVFIGAVLPFGAQWSDKNLCKTRPYGELVIEMNKMIAEWVKNSTTAISPVVLVDHYHSIDPARDMYDDIHPNNSGEDIMANLWFQAISRHIPRLKRK